MGEKIPYNEQERKTYIFLKMRSAKARNAYVQKVLQNPTNQAVVSACKRVMNDYPHWFVESEKVI